MGNKYIGTVDLKLGERNLVLRPTFHAVVEFEERTGLSIREALTLLAMEKISAKVIVTAIWAGIQGEARAQNNPSLEMDWGILGELMAKEGYKKFILPASTFLSNAWMSDEEVIAFSGEDEKKVEGEGS